MRRYTEDETNFLKQNYPLYGKKYCAKELNRSERSITKKCTKLELKLHPNTRSKLCKENNKSKKLNKVPYEQFININSKEISYLLGFLWSDGWIKKPYSIGLSIKITDEDDVKKVFEKTGIWNIYYRKSVDKRSGHICDEIIFQTSNKELVDFLIDNDYGEKSYKSANKILEKIPKELKNYFFRGVSDGDGCFYFNKKKNCHFYVSGSYNQDWCYVEELYKTLNIKYKISHVIKEKSKFSFIRIANKHDIDKFSNFIYGDKWDDIGLERKYKKSTVIKQTNIKIGYPKWTIEEKNFLIDNYSNGVEYCMSKLNRTKDSIYRMVYLTKKSKNKN